MAVTAAQVRSLAESRPPTLGAGRLICIDGPAGSGKTTLASGISAPTVHMDDLFQGWAGLDGMDGLDGVESVDRAVLGILTPLAEGRPGRYRRWDWAADRPAEEHVVDPGPLLVLEGVASGNRAWSGLCTALVFLDSDPATRLTRGMARDGERMRERWEKWMVDEQTVFDRESTRARADLVVTT